MIIVAGVGTWRIVNKRNVKKKTGQGIKCTVSNIHKQIYT